MFGRSRPKWPDSGRTPPAPVRSGRIPAILARSGWIQSDQAEFRPFWPDPARSMAESSQIRPDPGHFGQIRRGPVISGRILPFLPDPAGSGQIRPNSGRFLTMIGFRPDSTGIWSVGIRRRWPDVAGFRPRDDAGFRCRLVSDGRLLPDSGSQISNVRVMTKNIILENDLQFLFSKN